jgi:hypothetical protein
MFFHQSGLTPLQILEGTVGPGSLPETLAILYQNGFASLKDYPMAMNTNEWADNPRCLEKTP